MTDIAIADQTSVISKQELSVPLGFAEAQAEAAAAGVTNTAVILDPYETLNADKDPLVDRPFFIRAIKFMIDQSTGAEYANLWCVRDDNRLYRVTDGSTGIYQQLVELVKERIATNHPTPYNFFLIANGLKRSDYGVNAANKAVPLGDPSQVSKATTYYLA